MKQKNHCLSYILSILFFLNVFAKEATSEILNLENKKDFKICFFSLNNEKEYEEMEKFVSKLNKHSSDANYSISVNEYMINESNPTKSFSKMVNQKHCDGLVISGHHTGAFGGKRARGSLSIDFLESKSCNKEQEAWFYNIKALWLQGCRTLGAGDIASEEELSADYHTLRVGDVLDEDHLEQSFADLSTEFSATLDRDNPLSSRYLRAFPSANIFGWTKSAPGQKSQSELSLPFHITHFTKLLNSNQFPPDGPQNNSFTKDSAVKYLDSFSKLLSGDEGFSEIALSSWKNHGKVKNQSTGYGFYNIDLNSYGALINSGDQILKQARRYDCSLKDLSNPKDLGLLDDILKNQEFIKFTYNSIFNKLRSLEGKKSIRNKKLLSLMIKKLKESKEMSNFLGRKFNDKRVGVLQKIDYFAFYEKIYGEKENLKSVLLNNVTKIFHKLKSNTQDEVDYKVTLLRTLLNHNFFHNNKGIPLLELALTDSSEDVRIFPVKQSLKFGEERGLSVLEEALKDESEKIRLAVVNEASKFSHKGIFIIEQALKDQDLSIKEVAISKASNFGEKGFYLIDQIINDPSVKLRLAVVNEAFDFKERGSSILKKGLKDKSELVRMRALRFYLKQGKGNFSMVKQGFKYGNRWLRMEAVYRASSFGKKGFSIIEQAINDKSERVRIAAVHGALKYGEKGQAIIEQALGDKSSFVRQRATILLYDTKKNKATASKTSVTSQKNK